MNSIVFDEGIKEFEINNDPNRVLKFNPSDPGIVDRYYTCITKMEAELEKVKDLQIDPEGNPLSELSGAAETIKEVNRILRSNFDEVFYEGAADIVFGKQNPLALAGGNTIYENFMNAFQKIIAPLIEEEKTKSQKAVEKYRSQYREYVNKVAA